jgi:hypothetical protein
MNRQEEFDKRQREIRQNENTAQSVFQEKMMDLITREGSNGKNMREFQFPVPLSGVLDFSMLPITLKIIISRLKKLSFVSGEITDIKGFNEIKHLEEFNLSKQLITELNFRNLNGNLLWKTLNLEGNGIREMEWGQFMYLKQINVSYNRFVRLAALPRTLEIIDVRNNRLELLDLSRGGNLRYINASNNTTQLVIIPPPRENTEYELIQTNTSPFFHSVLEDMETETEEEKGEKGKGKKGNKREAMIQEVDYQEGLKKYFDYKSNYERKMAEEKRGIWNKYRHGKRGSISLARQMLTRYIPTCLNCEQPGGMVFHFLPEEKKYKGLCGASHPCSFRIEIFRSGTYMRIHDVLQEEMVNSEICKQDFIINKQELFFGYMDELSGIKKSKKILEECEETEKHIRFLKKEYDDLYDVERRKNIEQMKMKMGEIITQNKMLLSSEMGGDVSELLTKRRKTNNDWEENMIEEEEKGREEERLRMVVETEICELFPLVQKLRKETYDTMKIDDEEGYCRLIQEKIAFIKEEYNLSVEPPAVLAFSN